MKPEPGQEQLPCHFRAMIAAADRDENARDVIRDCLAEYRNVGDWEHVSSMLQMLADVEFEAGNRAAFEQLYVESIAVSPRPHSARLFYIDALLFCVKDRAAALSELTRLESFLADPLNAAAVADMPGTFYEDAIAALRAEAVRDDEPDPMVLARALMALPIPDDR